jgi:hypothetical protein
MKRGTNTGRAFRVGARSMKDRAAVSIGAGWISVWWLLAPVALSIALAVVHELVERRRAEAARAMAYYERALARVEDRWAGSGSQGERFRDPKHLYADDLDLFGRGSLFELLSIARTAAGERLLASWLLSPGSRDEALARQAAVADLRPRLDLREDIALMGEEIRAAVDDRTIKEWGERPVIRFFPGARLVAPVIAAAAAVTLVLFLTGSLKLYPFLVAVLAELAFSMAVREPARRVSESVGTPARELELVGLLLARLERETFASGRLKELHAMLQVEGKPASQRIQVLRRLVHHLDNARNQFFGVIAAPLLWVPQFIMAIEAWRARCGPYAGEWIAAVGEFEALCSLASFAYERPSAVFPDLAEGSEPVFDAAALVHPLIPPRDAVANDVSLGRAGGGAADDPPRLWVVSGSNMSGKSTLLRAVGLNAVLAWAGAPVTAARLRVSRLDIGASMRVNDSLTDHRSRFYAEISRLREIMDLARAGRPTLFLLDELLSGTNSHDRRIGAEALIRGLVERGAIGLVTTHDLALADIVESFQGRAANVHFEDDLDESGQIRFDYRLRAGVVTRSNALALMRAVGLDV